MNKIISKLDSNIQNSHLLCVSNTTDNYFFSFIPDQDIFNAEWEHYNLTRSDFGDNDFDQDFWLYD